MNHDLSTYQQAESMLAAIKREASSIDLYSRLLKIVPNQNHKNHVLYVLEGNKSQLRQFTDLFVNLTGTQPHYEIDIVPFQNYKEGLEKAYELEAEGSHAYQNHCHRSQNPYIQYMFMQASAEKIENANRCAWLFRDTSTNAQDYGGQPFVVNIDKATKENNTYRTAIWTGDHLQVTLMSIDVGDDIGLEVHPHTDQFLRIEQGQGIVQMGDREDYLDFQVEAFDGYAIMIPAGKWHNVTNTGDVPLKLYAIYAPPEHPFGTIHETKAIAMAAEHSE